MFGLFSGLTCKINLKIFFNSLEYVDDILGYIPFTTNLYNSSIDSASNGGRRAAISYIMHPNDQMSLLEL